MARQTRARVLVTPERIARLPKWAREHIDALQEGRPSTVDPERIERLPQWAFWHIDHLERQHRAGDTATAPVTRRLTKRPRLTPGDVDG